MERDAGKIIQKKPEPEFIAHRREESGEDQSLAAHLFGVASESASFAIKFNAYDWGYAAGIAHDIGKYSAAFQRRIRGSTEQVDHATAGAQLYWKKGGFYRFLSYAIAGHHAGLPDTGGPADTGGQATMYGRLAKKISDYQAYQNDINIWHFEVKEPPFQNTKEENAGFFCSMLIRMIYSCLVDADFLDTEEFMRDGNTVFRMDIDAIPTAKEIEKQRLERGDSVERMQEKLEQYTARWRANQDLETINGRRTEILLHCEEMGKNAQGLYRLTVPTGGGKTIASLAFALKHACVHHLDRVIYVIPYTSIIEQNAAVFASILGWENVLENHCNVDYALSEEFKSAQLAAENWDRPVVVTTNVQFLQCSSVSFRLYPSLTT